VRTVRVALHTRLRPGAEQEYERAHREVPAGLVDAIRAGGATAWTIWRSGLELFAVIDCEDYPRLLAALDALPVNREWQQRMSVLLEVSHDYSSTGASQALPVVWRL